VLVYAICGERFNGTQKEDDWKPISIPFSLAKIIIDGDDFECRL